LNGVMIGVLMQPSMTPRTTRSISLSSRARTAKFSSGSWSLRSIACLCSVWRGSFRRRECNVAHGRSRRCDRRHSLVEWLAASGTSRRLARRTPPLKGCCYWEAAADRSAVAPTLGPPTPTQGTDASNSNLLTLLTRAPAPAAVGWGGASASWGSAWCKTMGKWPYDEATQRGARLSRLCTRRRLDRGRRPDAGDDLGPARGAPRPQRRAGASATRAAATRRAVAVREHPACQAHRRGTIRQSVPEVKGGRERKIDSKGGSVAGPLLLR